MYRGSRIAVWNPAVAFNGNGETPRKFRTPPLRTASVRERAFVQVRDENAHEESVYGETANALRRMHCECLATAHRAHSGTRWWRKAPSPNQRCRHRQKCRTQRVAAQPFPCTWTWLNKGCVVARYGHHHRNHVDTIATILNPVNGYRDQLVRKASRRRSRLGCSAPSEPVVRGHWSC